MSGATLGWTVLQTLVAAGLVAIVVWLFHWLYRRSSKEISFVRTGCGGQKVVIGRGEGCDVALFGDPDVERQHARIVLRKGRYWLEDLASPEGTYLNGEVIDRPEPLRDGDRIEVGRAILRFGERQRRAEEE